MNAATEHAWDLAMGFCNSLYYADNVWYGCKSSETPSGGHAMTIVGQDKGQKLLIRNSWGRGWGMKGQYAGHVWFDKSVWSNKAASGYYATVPLTRTEFDSGSRKRTTVAPAPVNGKKVNFIAW